MVRVVVTDEGKEYVLHDIHSQNEQIYEDEWSEAVGRTPTFKFMIDPVHPYIEKIKPLSSEILIYENDQVVFFGRVMTPSSDIYNTHTVQCMGGLSYLADSQQAPFTLTGPVRDFLEQVLNVHNSMVEQRKRMKLGVVNVAGREATREVQQYTDTLSLLFKELVDVYGGYLRVRQESDGRYLDYVSDYGGINTQTVRFGENVLDLSRQIDASEIITVLIPEGAEMEITNADGSLANERITIASVNGGSVFIESPEAITKWGRIWGYAAFDDIADPEELLFAARRYLQQKVTFPETVNFTALDLSLTDVSVESLKLGYWTQFVSIPHKINGNYLLQSKSRHITAPHKDTVSFGATRNGISGTVASGNHNVTVQIGKVKQSTSKEINRKVENATQLITGGQGGYFVIGLAKDGHPEETLWMDTPDKQTATCIIRINKNGIGFSTTGINGPYRNAWTIDGNLVADFVTTGTMLADRIRGGTLELGGTGLGKDGAIMVKDASGNPIGSWDKTGLSVLRGILQGVSAIFGGAGNQSGAIEVRDASGKRIGRWDSNGFYISKGNIEVGPFYADDDMVCFGDYYVSADGSNLFSSSDGSISIQTQEGGPLGHYAALGIGTTEVSDHHVEATTVAAGELFVTGDSWWSGWSLTRTMKWLDDRISDLENSDA